MKSPPSASATLAPRRGRPRTQRKLDHLLRRAARLIAEQGFEATSIRHVGREVGASLAGMYYYFKSKEDLLFQIQYRTFASLLQAQEEIAASPGTAEERFRRLLVGHLAFFASHPNEMKVCTYEMESLAGALYDRLENLRRRYFRVLAGVVSELMDGTVDGEEASRESRYATLFIFGMLNWVFMWYDPRRDLPLEQLGEEMLDLVLNGLGRGRRSRKRET
jgi:AcrR family transcriptional regulator